MVTREYHGDITLMTLANRSGASVTLSTLGAAIVSVRVPSSAGDMADVVLGYSDPDSYRSDAPCAGKIIGRFANRIGGASFRLDGCLYPLTKNDGRNSLHGGPAGFQNRVWTVVAEDADSVTMEYVSADGEEGFPGELRVRAVYEWTEGNSLVLSLQAVTDRPTVINLTNHVYFNLDGHDSGSGLGQLLEIPASCFVVIDDEFIPTGEIAAVSGDVMDFRRARTLSSGMAADGSVLLSPRGYNHFFILDDRSRNLRTAAVLRGAVSGRKLEVLTTHCGVQLYTGGWLAGCPLGKEGAVYGDYAGVALECQAYPDAPNHPEFPPATLMPGEEYNQTIVFRFSTQSVSSE